MTCFSERDVTNENKAEVKMCHFIFFKKLNENVCHGV